MNRLTGILCSLSAALLIAACESPVIVGTADFDPSVDFDTYRSFAWISDNPMIIAGERPPRLSPLLEQRIKNTIQANLTEKGYSFSEDPEASDLIVSFTIGLHDKIDVQSYPTAYRGDWGWGGGYWGYGGSRTVTWNYVEGTLAIDLFDGVKKQPVWHGWATKDIFEGETVDVEKEVRTAVDGILESFPPGTS